MHIPNPDLAIIDRAKIEDYLLSRTHPVGGSKFIFFVNLGYSPKKWWILERDLRLQHLTMDAIPVPSTPHGQKYEIRARINGPLGRGARVVSVWIMRAGEDFPRFVTAYPEGE